METKVESIKPIHKAIDDLDTQIKNLENEIFGLSARFWFVLSPIESMQKQMGKFDEAGISPCRNQIINLALRVAGVRQAVSDLMLHLEI